MGRGKEEGERAPLMTPKGGGPDLHKDQKPQGKPHATILCGWPRGAPERWRAPVAMGAPQQSLPLTSCQWLRPFWRKPIIQACCTQSNTLRWYGSGKLLHPLVAICRHATNCSKKKIHKLTKFLRNLHLPLPSQDSAGKQTDPILAHHGRLSQKTFKVRVPF